MEAVRIAATAVRPGHTVRLEYGRDILIAVTEVHIEAEWVRLCGALSYTGAGEPYKHTTDSRHSHHTRMRVVADRNDSPAGINPAWNDLARVVRQWTDGTATVWSLDDPAEPIGHGSRLCGEVAATAAGWVWRAAYSDTGGELVGDYLTAERALLNATDNPHRRLKENHHDDVPR